MNRKISSPVTHDAIRNTQHAIRNTLTLLLFFAILLPAVAHAQTPPTIVANEAQLNFPDTVDFRLEVAEATAVRNATLIYDLDQATCLEVPSRVPVEAEDGLFQWSWVMSRSGNPPPGAEMWWQWELETADGQIITTPRQTLIFADDRFDWRTVSAAGIHLNWYEGEDVGPTLLDAAVAGLETLEEEMGIQLQSDVQFFIYADPAAMRQAVLYVQDWAGGVAFDEYNVILMGVRPSAAEGWGRRTVRHELAHLVVGQYARSCVGGRRPTWLEEGLAMYAEGEPDETLLADLERGRAQNAFLPLRSLNGPFPAHDSDASMAYSQSYSVIDFMLKRYGEEAMQALLQILAEGEGYDQALTSVYGLTVDGLEQEWRQALDLPLRQIPPTPTPLSAAAVPTILPVGAPEDVPTPPGAAQPPPQATSPLRGVCGLGMIPVLLLVSGLAWRRRGGER